MNTIYKIQWSGVRRQFVVTNETSRSQRKGRWRSSVIATAVAGALVSAGASANGLTQSNITAQAGWDHTTIINTNGKFDVTTDRVVHGIGENRFERFELKAGNIANLHHGAGSDKLVNFVNQKIKIDGTVNSIVGSQVGGELFFVSPYGMTVGTSGVINTGSLTAIAPEALTYAKYLTTGGADLTDQTLAAWRAGEVPINRNATISIKGSINAGNNVSLVAAHIDVAEGARISTRTTDFSDLVNIKDAADTVILSADVTDGALSGKVDAAGDVVLMAVGDTTRWQLDESGKEKLDEFGNPTGAAVFYEDTSATIKIDGVIDARNSVTAKALAGNGNWDGTQFVASGTNLHTNVNASVAIAGTITADNALTVNATALNHLDNSAAKGFIGTVDSVATWFLNNQLYITFDAAYGNLTTDASVTVAKEAVLTAEKGPLSLTAKADTNLTIGSSPATITTFHQSHQETLLSKGIPTASAAVGLVDNDASVVVEGELTTGGNLTLGADAALTADVWAEVGTINHSGPEISLVVANLYSNAETAVKDTASITVGAAGQSVVDIHAVNTNSVATSASASIQDEAYAGVVMNYTEMNTDAKVTMDIGIVNEARSIDIKAANTTKSLTVKADAGIGPFAFVKRAQQTIGTVPLNFVAGLMGNAALGIDPGMTEANFRLGGSVGVFAGQQSASVDVNAPKNGTLAGLRSKGDVKITSSATIKDHQFYANSRVVTSNTENSLGQASLALFVSTAGGQVGETDGTPTLYSTVNIDDGTAIEVAAGNIVIESEALVTWTRVQTMQNQLKGLVAMLEGLWTDLPQTQKNDMAVVQAWEAVKNAAASCETAFNGIGTTDSFLGGLAYFNEGIQGLSETVTTFLDLVQPFVNTAGLALKIPLATMGFMSPTNYVNTYVASGGRPNNGAFAAAGAIAIVNQWAKSDVQIGKLVEMTARGTDTPESTSDGKTIPAILRGRVTVAGRTENDGTMLVGHLENLAGFSLPNIHSGNAVGASLGIQTIDTTNIVRVREGVRMTADNAVTVDANDAVSSILIGGSSNVSSGTLGVDLLGAVSVTNGNNRLELDDEVLIRAKDIRLEARRTDDLQTIAGTLLVSHGSSAAGSAGAALATNVGSMENHLVVQDNDGETSKTASVGHWHADGTLAVRANADTAINALSVAGSVSVDTDDGTAGAMDRLAAWTHTHVTSGIQPKFVGFARTVNQLQTQLLDTSYTAGQQIHDHITFNQTQNATDSAVAGALGQQANGQNPNPGQIDLSGQGANGATTAGANTTNAATDPAASALKINLAGTLAVNATDINNTVQVDVESMTLDASSVTVEAVSDKWIGTWAGTAGVTYMGYMTGSDWASTATVGIAGAVAVNASVSNASVFINANRSTGTGLVIRNSSDESDPTQTSATDVSIYAVNDGNIVTEALVATLARGGGVTVGADVNIAANVGGTTTQTTVDGIELVGTTDGTDNRYDQAAWVGDTQVTGGTGMGFATATHMGASSNQLGFVVAVADMDNTVQSTLTDADIEANRVDVRALASLVQVTTAVNAQTAGSKCTFAFAGTAGTAALTNVVKADVNNAAIKLTGNDALMQVIARDATDDEHAALDAVTETAFAFDKTIYTYVDADGVTQTGDAKSNSAFYEDATVYTDADKTASGTLNVGDFLATSNMVQSSVVISLGVAGSGQTAGVATDAGVLVNQINNTFETSTQDVTVSHAEPTRPSGFTQSAESSVVSVGVGLGSAGSGGKFAAAGSVIVSDIHQTVRSQAEALTLQTHETQFLAGNRAISANVAGNAGVSVGQSSAAVGAAIAVTNTYNTADVSLTSVAIDNEAGPQASLVAAARNEAVSVGVSIDAGVSMAATVGGSVLVNRALNDSTVVIDGLALDEVAATQLIAQDDTQLISLAGNVAVGGQAGVSGAVVYTGSGNDSTGTRVDAKNVTVTNESDEEATRSELALNANSTDRLVTLATSVGVASQAAGVAGVATTNDVHRTVEASLGNVTAEGTSLKSVTVTSGQDTDIDNGAIVAAAGSAAGVGVGVSVNRIDNETNARLYDDRTTPKHFATDVLRVSAVTDNDLDTVAVGGSGAGTASVSGSVGVNLIDADTTVEVDGVRASFATSLVEARSDDTIGNYGGQASGAGTVAEGLTVTVSEKKGTTAATVKNAELTETGGTASLSTQTGVADSDIADGFVQDLNSVVSLKNKRQIETVKGLGVFASSTENFKTFLINGTGAGVQSAVGTNNVTYHGGKTALTVADSVISTVDGLETLSGDYVAVDTSMNSATGSQVAVAETVNVTTTEHATTALFSGNKITGNVDHRAEAKEGLSHLILGIAGSFYATVSPVVNVNRFLSDVTTTVEQSTVDAGRYDQQTTYLGYANGGSGLGNGAAFAAAGVNVNVNYFGNDVKNIVSDSHVDADTALTVTADRTVDVQMVDVTLTGAIGAIGAYVNVNTIEGETLTQVTRGSQLTGSGEAAICARNLDRIHLVGVNGAGGLGAGGATVVVNDVYGKATVEVANSTIDMNTVDLRVSQDRDLSAVAAFGGVAGMAVQANVIVNNIGSNEEAFATSETGLQDTEALVERYRTDYASASGPGQAGVLSTLEATADAYLTEDEKTSLMQSAATDASQVHQATGTIVAVHSSIVKADGALSVTAQEDTGSEAAINVEAGMGTAGVASVAASVATLRYNHAAAVFMTASALSANGTTIGAYWGGDKHVAAYQGTLALGTAVAAYADVKLVGGATVKLSDTSVASDKETTIEYRDTSTVSAEAFGLTIGGMAGGGTVAHLEDLTASAVVVTGGVGSALTGDTTLRSIRDAERHADVTAGYGALVVGVGALAKVYDHGKHAVTVENATVTGDALTVSANNQMTLTTSAKGDGASVVGVGVVEAYTHARGDTSVTLGNNTIASKEIVVSASSGRETGNAEDALQLKSEGEAYSGTVVADINVNASEIVNSTTTTLCVKNNTFATDSSAKKKPTLDLSATGYATYDAVSGVGGGGIAYSGNTLVRLEHAADVSVELDAGSDTAILDRLTVQAINKEAVQAQATSYGGGAIVVEMSSDKVNSAEIRHKDTSDTTVSVGGTFEVTEDAQIKSSSVHDLAVDVENNKGAFAGGSGAALQNTMTGESRVLVADNTNLTVGGSLYLDARADLRLTGLRDVNGKVKDSVVVESAIYGGFTGTGISINNSVDRATHVTIGRNARLLANDRLQASAFTAAEVDWRVRANSTGAVEGVSAVSDHDITIVNTVTVGADAHLSNRNVDAAIVLSAAGHETYYIESIGDVQGAAIAGAGGNSTLDYTRHNTVAIADGAKVLGAGRIQLSSGRNADGIDSLLDVTVLSHAYAHSLISGVDAEINDTFITNDTITVDGYVLAARSIEAYADQGSVSTLEEARRWSLWAHKDWGDTEMASTAMGVKSRNMTETSRLTVNEQGRLEAGTQTTFDLIVEGIVDPDGNDDYSLEGSQQQPTLTFSSDTNVVGTYALGEMNVANYYWDRHEYLTEQMALYLPGDSSTNDGIYYALKAEDDYLLQRMVEEGYAKKNGDGTYSAIASDKMHVVFSVSDITVSGGVVDITSDAVNGRGTIAAHYADGITIDNRSSMVLSVKDLQVLDDGGTVTFNKVNVSSAATLEGFGGTVVSAGTSAPPVINVTSRYAGDPIKVTSKDPTETGSQSYVPDSSILLDGTIANRAGAVTIRSDDDIRSTADISAAGSLTLNATTGAIVQGYQDGITNIGANPQDIWNDKVTEAMGKTDGSTVHDATVRDGNGAFIAGGDIVISGDLINVNGLIQSGYAQYGIELTQAELDRIKAIESAWSTADASTNLNPRTNEFVVHDGGYAMVDGQYVYRTTAWYDPRSDRIILDDITPQGGHVYLTGRIANTGGGRIVVADGHATVKVDAGQFDVQTGYISTGNVRGAVTITDTSWADATYAYRITEYTPNDGGATQWNATSKLLRKSDGQFVSMVVAKDDAYDPYKDLVYTWSKGQGEQTVTTTETKQDFKWWGLDEKPEGDPVITTNTTTNKLEELDAAESIVSMDTKHGTYEIKELMDTNDAVFQSHYLVKTSDSSSSTKTWTTYKNFMHFKGTHYEKTVVTETNQVEYQFAVRADQSVGVDRISGNNSISITSDKTVYLGGDLEAQNGTVSIKAGQSIVQMSDGNAVRGAAKVTLSANTGSIGSETRAVNLAGSNGVVLTAQAGKDIYVDAMGLAAGASLEGSVNGEKTVQVSTSSDLRLTALTGTDIKLNAQNGRIFVTSVTQKHHEDGKQRLDATAGGDIDLVNGNALWIGQIESGGDVRIEAEQIAGSRALDANDTMSADEKVQHWIDIGILGEGGVTKETRYAQDKANVETEMRAAWSRMQAYDELGEDRNAAQQNEYDALTQRFAGFDTVDAYIADQAGTEGTMLNLIETSKDKYHAWNKTELLYAVAESVINPDASTGSSATRHNIRANGTIRLESTGLIGEYADAQTFDLTQSFVGADGNVTAQGKAFYETISRAQAQDVVWDRNTHSISVSLKNPITVDFVNDDDTQSLSADASSVYVQTLSDKALRVSAITAADAVRLTSGNGIFGVGEDHLIQGAAITLHGAKGSIGTDALAVRIDASESVTLTAEKSINLTDSDGDLVIASLSAGKEACLTTVDGDILSLQTSNDLPQGVISAESLHLNVNGAIGANDFALQLQDVQSVTVNNDLDGMNVVIGGTTDTTVGTNHSFGTIVSDGRVSIESEAGMTMRSDLTAAGEIVLKAADDLTTAAIRSALTGDDVSLEAGGTLAIGKDIGVADAGGDITLIGKSIDIADNVTLRAAAGRLKVDADALRIGSDDTFVAKGIEWNITQSLVADGATFETGIDGLTLTSDASIDLKRVTMTSEGEIIVTAGDRLVLDRDVSDTNRAVVTATGAVVLSGTNGVAAEKLSVDVDSLTVSSASGAIDLTDAQLDASGDIEVSGATGLVAENASVEANAVTMRSSEGSVNVSDADVTSVDALTLSARDNLTADRLTATVGSMSAIASDGGMTLSEAVLTAFDTLELSAKGDLLAQGLQADVGSLVARTSTGSIVAIDARVTADESAAIVGGKDVLADRLDVGADKVEMHATAGDVQADAARLNASDTLAVTAEQNVSLVGAEVPTALTGALIYAAQEGDVDLRQAQSLDGSGQSGTGTLVADSITVTAGGRVDLNGNALDWKATGIGSSATSGDITLQSDEVALAAGSMLTAGSDASATRGDLTVRTTGDMTQGEGTRLTASHGHVELDVGGTLTLGQNSASEGESLTMQAGELVVGKDNTFVSTDGDVRLLIDDDATLGGKLSISAQKGSASADIEIAAGGVLSVTDDALTIEAQSGAVTLSGAHGMNIQNDLTIVSHEDARLETDTGSITIGNSAVIKAGTASGLAADQYGRIEIDSADAIAIGEKAVVFADELSVRARGDVSFGNDAVLHGTTGGVTIVSDEGDIVMGQHLEILSNADTTRLTAKRGDIRIAQAAELTSSNSTIRFEAGSDVVFDDHLIVNGEGFVIQSGRDIVFGDDVSVKTEYTTDKNEPVGSPGVSNANWQTMLCAGRDVAFGDRATFDTTMLGITAGSATQAGSVVFGDDSRIETSRYGIAVVAWDDIVFGERAVFGTLDAAQGGTIALLAQDGIRMAKEAVIKSKGNIAVQSVNGDIAMGENAALIDLNDDRLARLDVISEYGNVSIDRNARLIGAWIEVAAQGGDLTLGDGTSLLADASGQVDLEASNNLLLDGRITVLAPDVMLTSHDGDIRFGRDSTIVGYGTQDVERLLMQSGRDIDMSQTAVVVATTDVELKADRDICIGGESRIYSDKSVLMTAENGDIALSGATRIGSSDSDVTRYTDRVALKAGGDVRQDDVDVNRGIVAKELTVSAGGTVTLGAVDQSQTTAAMRKLFLAKGGNIAQIVSVDAGGDIVLALTSPIDSTLTINASRAGTVSGDLIVHGQGNALSFANDLTVQGDTSLHGARVTFGRIEGAGLVELSSDQYDTTTTDGLYGGSITARRIVLLTGEGNIDIDALRSTDDLISVARKSLDVEGAIHIDGVDSAYTLNVYNGRGGISTAGMRAADVVALFTGDAGVKADASVLQSDTNVVMRIDGADSVAKYLTSDYLSGRDASLIVPGFVPLVSIDQQALDDADKVVDDGDIDALIGYVRDGGFTGSLRYDVRDFWTPWMRIKHNVVYFPFDSDVLTDAGRAALDRVVETAYEYGISVTFVNVGGHTDRLGGEAYNRALADRRAKAVKSYLIDKGVPADRIETSARGKSNAIVECGPTSDVKRCLSPNRRSVIEIEAETPRSKVEPAYSI